VQSAAIAASTFGMSAMVLRQGPSVVVFGTARTGFGKAI
jgi:hypothetical protein